MRWLLVTCICFFTKILMRLRYSVKIKGKDLLNKKALREKEGILFLPNHPAHIDPILINIFLWPKFKLRPVVVEYIFRQSGINALMKAIRALSIPNFDTSLNEIKLKKAKETIQAIIDGIHKKENFLIYPAGRLKHTGKEILGGSSAVHTILKQCPEANVVMIRTTGLWGSSFSRAYLGITPDFKSMAVRGIKYVFKSLIFFMPRRKVLIEIEIAPTEFPRQGSRLEINKYLESWYNNYPVNGDRVSIEPVTSVSYSPFRKVFLKLPKNDQKTGGFQKEFSSQLEQEVYTELARISKRTESIINLDMNLAQDLGLDSLDIAELITFLNINYDIPAISPEDMQTVADVLEIAEGTKKIEKRKLEEVSVHKWPLEKKRPDPTTPMGKIIPEAFLNICHKMKNHPAIADDLLGVLSYKKLKLVALVLAEEIRKMPGKNIAILLPSSCIAYIVILATLLANKVPVMLNWTLGPRFLNHMMQVTHSEKVITSWKFLEKLSNVEFGLLTKKICHVEDIKKEISRKKKLATFFKSFKSTKRILKNLGLDSLSENENAVILFTSGTESNPKGVPLTHKNILFNQSGAIEMVGLKSNDIFYGILPPFHSFGFSLAGILPILAGVKVAYFPDPTDSYALAEGIHRWNITIICSAPSFLRGLLQVGTKDQLKSIRYFVTGAEKTPKELFEKVKSLGNDKILLEGYGITECAPCLTINLGKGLSSGVGRPLKGVEICIIESEGEQVIDKTKEGEVCVKGPNVFKGYIGEQKDPFIEIDGYRWYRTGDLGYFDKEGNLILSGRLKRFTKVAGEMVSLGAVEEVISDEIIRSTNKQPDGAIVAICAFETDGKRPKLVLFTTIEMNKNEANMILKEAGFSNLVKISEVKRIDTIPLMGTGKVDYRYLQTLVE